jgi:hypothetical protein
VIKTDPTHPANRFTSRSDEASDCIARLRSGPEVPSGRRRLMELLEWVIGPDLDNRDPWSKELECSEAAIRRRQKTGTCRRRDVVIRKLGSTCEMLDNAAELDWQAHLKSLPFQQPPKKPAVRPLWLYRTPDLIAYIRTIGQ